MLDERENLLMTPGPTELPPEVRRAMSESVRHPDVDAEFPRDYRTLLDKVATVYGTDDDILVLGGDAILGLEASIASIVSPGDAVLCLANGVYGEGFVDFVTMYDGDPVTHSVPYTEGFDIDAIKSLVETHEFTAATMVHCETPTGVLNDLDEVLAVLQDAGVITIVDAVSSLGGTRVPVDGIDICIGASQKCFSSPPGLTTVSVSDRAWATIEDTEQNTFYTSFAPWQDVDLDSDEPVFLPYTHLVSNLSGFEASVDRILDEGVENVYDRHASVAALCRERGRDLGLTPYAPAQDRWSPTVTAFAVDATAGQIQRRLDEDHDVLIATGLGDVADDIIRVGHMGYNATADKVERTMDALASVVE